MFVVHCVAWEHSIGPTERLFSKSRFGVCVVCGAPQDEDFAEKHDMMRCTSAAVRRSTREHDRGVRYTDFWL